MIGRAAILAARPNQQELSTRNYLFLVTKPSPDCSTFSLGQRYYIIRNIGSFDVAQPPRFFYGLTVDFLARDERERSAKRGLAQKNTLQIIKIKKLLSKQSLNQRLYIRNLRNLWHRFGAKDILKAKFVRSFYALL